MEESSNGFGSSTFARPPTIPVFQYHYHSPDGATRWKGPRRVCIFCSLAIVLPSLLISVPLLMRFVIYGSNTYIVHPSDMRILDQRISTTWCQGEKIRANTSFSAYVTNGEPGTYGSPAKLSYERSMLIPDDHKKYWGLYLLPGSTFRIRVCARFKGGTLLIVKGNRHMQYCAYEGEADSAGNSDEVSGSTSIEYAGLFRPGSKPISLNERPPDDQKILSRLKNFLQSHPNSRDKIQKTLEDWMLLNTSIANGNAEEEAETTTTPAPDTGSLETILERGTISRKRRDITVRRETESGEDGAFEDESSSDDLPFPHKSIEKGRNSSVSILNLPAFQVHREPPASPVWREEHDHHTGSFNISISPNDGSDSESESSFSSSEEALLKCEGIIASYKIPYEPQACLDDGLGFDQLPLKKIIPGMDSNEFEFTVKERDYYYFIFGSENERETNLVRAKFELEKIEYTLPQPLDNCTNVHECQISFAFASSEKVVIKLPLPTTPTTSSSNVAYLAETECEPRAHLYLIFVILVPIVILLFAFK